MAIDINASRIKKDLLSSKEDEIIVLLKEKVEILDRLIAEAKIYKNEKDPLIQKDFFGLPNVFATKFNSRQKYIYTSTDSSLLVPKKKSKGYLGISSNKISSARHSSFQERDIFNIKMRKKSNRKTAFPNNINFLSLLEKEALKGTKTLRNKIYKKEIVHSLDDLYSKKFQSLANEISKKYLELISLLSANDFSKKLNKMVASNSVKGWSVYSEMFNFEFSLKRDKLLKKKTYDLSIVLHDTFEHLHSKKEIKLTGIPAYYDKEGDKDLRCIETAKNIKYKGRICINPIDVDKDIYFENGTFETRENNFLQTNKTYLSTLKELDDKLKSISREYIKFIILKISSPTEKREINLDGGL